MSKYSFDLDEQKIVETAERLIAEGLVTQYHTESREAKHGIRKGVEKAVKDFIYSQKDTIIEKCIAKASAELVRKALPHLLDKLNYISDEEKKGEKND